jgi:enoyl-CoA hydratase
MSEPSPHIRVDRQDSVAVITIDRPDKLNALNAAIVEELDGAVRAAAADAAVRGLLITGAGEKAFVAGADIAEMREMNPLQAQALAEMGGNLARSIETSSKVYIAA